MKYWLADNTTTPTDGHEATPLDIEITAYVLLSLMKEHSRTDIIEGSKIVRWLTLQRNSYGGFKSTQVISKFNFSLNYKATQPYT